MTKDLTPPTSPADTRARPEAATGEDLAVYQRIAHNYQRDTGAAVVGAVGEFYRHVKSGGIYELVCRALDEANPAVSRVIYRSATGVLWDRLASEFDDGRFVRLAAPSPAPMFNGLTEAGTSSVHDFASQPSVEDSLRQLVADQQSRATASVAGLPAVAKSCADCKTPSACRAHEECIGAGQAVAEAELPALPEPLLEGVDWELWGQNVQTDCYTADQMRAYARAALSAQKLAVPADPRPEAATGEDLAIYQSIADNYKTDTQPKEPK